MEHRPYREAETKTAPAALVATVTAGAAAAQEGEPWRWCPRCGHELQNEKCKFRCPRCHYFMSCSDFD